MEAGQDLWRFAWSITVLGMGVVFVALAILVVYLEAFKRAMAGMDRARRAPAAPAPRASDATASRAEAAAAGTDPLEAVALAAAAAHLRRRAQAWTPAPRGEAALPGWRLAGRLDLVRRLATRH